jgi:hypothetical protein
MWQDRTSVRKGTLGEQIVHAHLEKNGYIVYSPATEGAHAFDKLAVRNKREIIIAECKTKARRKYYPDTGIDCKHYNEYKYIENLHNIPVFIFFVDELVKKVYGNKLSILEKPRNVKYELDGKRRYKDYPLVQGNIIYFPMVAMEDIATLTENDCSKLISVSTRSYDYSLSANGGVSE